MLDELHVRNIALIEDANLEFPAGLTVLTGETGAGKTALLAALKLICGARADASVVRDGADEAVAEARILDGEERVVRRRLSATGRSRCSIDGAMASVGELAQVSSSIEMHGQHEQVLLLEPARQLAYLDAWARNEELLASYEETRAAYVEARDAFERLERARDRDVQELEFMRFTCEQIEKVDPRQGEYEQLEEELPRLQHADQLHQALSAALSALHDDGAAIDLIAQARSALARQQGIDAELDEMTERLEAQMSDIEDLARDLGSYAQSIDVDPYRLEETLSRLEELSGLMRRFGPDMAHVLMAWEQAKASVEAAQGSPERLLDARAEMELARERFERRARELSEARREAAPRFCEQLGDAVAELAMEGAAFEFSFAELPFERWGQAGAELGELLYQPASAAKPRPLRRIASGGELSRILLALECMHYESVSASTEAATIVFDEVDSGIGGTTAQAVARKLAELADSAQVIVVTHLAQVAARADKQYVVVKQSAGDALACTQVVPVEGEARVAEIARMLSGDGDDVALEHARSLLAETESRS